MEVIRRLKNLYSSSTTIVMVNNIPGKAVDNIRQSLRQGDLPSMHFFSFGIDPLLVFLEKRLKGILITALPVLGPVQEGHQQLLPLEERYKLIGYADDVKRAITTMHEFSVVDMAMGLFEKASGCQLHRDPASKKCKFLPLARWRGTLQQEVVLSWKNLMHHFKQERNVVWSQTRKPGQPPTIFPVCSRTCSLHPTHDVLPYSSV